MLDDSVCNKLCEMLSTFRCQNDLDEYDDVTIEASGLRKHQEPTERKVDFVRPNAHGDGRIFCIRTMGCATSFSSATSWDEGREAFTTKAPHH